MKILNKLKIQHYKNEHPTTYAEKFSDKNQEETVLTCEDDVSSHQSLDYIFEVFFDNEDYNSENIVKRLMTTYVILTG